MTGFRGGSPIMDAFDFRFRHEVALTDGHVTRGRASGLGYRMFDGTLWASCWEFSAGRAFRSIYVGGDGCGTASGTKVVNGTIYQNQSGFIITSFRYGPRELILFSLGLCY
ncbi:hypothetical protein Zmor_024541 [Zophobas morio]|uniref:Uncharacterized protein n=1 Tax=Zophobas morio TaxID=2755281 RepID=A0AA38M888_9CUCU|nr:hypothetical protein Zmor_024541 [Zophobas morio]